MQPPPSPIPAPVPAPEPSWNLELWSVLGTWAGAVGSILAAAAALWIAHQSWSRADAERRDQDKAQARLVEIGPRRGRMAGLAVYNHSPAPVFDVTPDFIAFYDDPDLRGYPEREAWSVLDAGDEHLCTTTVRRRNGELLGSQEYRSTPTRYDRMSVTFTDAEGRRWQRFGRDEPVRLTD